MELFEAVYRRRSVRKYEDRNIEPQIVEKILKAAMQAPTARNFQEWIFYVVRDKAKLDEISRRHPYAKMAKDAPVAIAICANIKNETNEKYYVQDCAAATQNILLSATALGVGSVWISAHPSRSGLLKEALEIPDEIEVVSLVCLGYPAETKGVEDRFDPLKIVYIG